MGTKQNVTKKEYSQWVKFLNKQGYSGPFVGLTTKHECVKLLYKELKRDPPSIIEAGPRDKRTIVSNLDRYGRRKSWPRPGKGETEIAYPTIDATMLLNLPLWVNQAQWEHLEGREQRDEREGMDIITYLGGIRQQLGLFQGCFPKIDPRTQSLCHPLDDGIVMAQLHGHLPDEAFWSRAKDFWQKAKECDALHDAACQRFTSAGDEVARLRPSRGPEPDAYTTSGWARRVLVRALSKELGFKEPREYHHQKLPNGGFMLEDDGLIYVGPDDVAPEQKHRELVDDFRQTTEEFNLIVSLMKDLQNLRQEIIVRIDQCLRKKEYSFNYCPDCPAEQARKLLLADK